MQKLIKIAAFALMLTAFSNVNAQSAADQNLIGKARAAAHDCLQNYAGMDINAWVETTGICFVSGSTHKVTFSAGPRCSGNGPCPYFVIRAATVQFDCEGNATVVTCSE